MPDVAEMIGAQRARRAQTKIRPPTQVPLGGLLQTPRGSQGPSMSQQDGDEGLNASPNFNLQPVPEEPDGDEAMHASPERPAYQGHYPPQRPGNHIELDADLLAGRKY